MLEELQFDVVVVGAGPGGSAVAARLADARPDWRIALVETGPARGNAIVSMPAGLAAGLAAKKSRYNYHYQTLPQPELYGRVGSQPRGRGVGGSSLINAMVFIRGQPQDYDDWVAAGCHGWGWQDVLPLFKRSEDNTRGADAFHGTGGPLHVTDLMSAAPITQTFIDASLQAGYRRNDDFNGVTQEGVGIYQVFQKGGRRFDAGSAYIHARIRPNLALFADTQARRVVIQDGRASAVVIAGKGGERVLKAANEVVLAGGAFGTPQLLMLSGIGPAEHLRDCGVSVIADRAGVGENLQDHLDHISSRTLKGYGVVGPTFGGALPMVKGAIPYLLRRPGTLSSNLAEGGAFLRSSPDQARPDIQLHFMIGLIEDPATKNPRRTGVCLHACLLRPASRGTVRLAGSDPSMAPVIDPRYLSAAGDLDGMVRGVRIAETILSQPVFQNLGAAAPGAMSLTSEEAIIDSIRRRASTIYHPVGTCRMGSDDDAVVDLALRVRGVSGLRIADASIMPTLISGNTQAASAMIGERAADLILNATIPSAIRTSTSRPMNDIHEILAAQRKSFSESMPESLAIRKDRLRRAAVMLRDNAHRLCDAMSEDFGHRSREQSMRTDINGSIQPLESAISHVDSWARREKRKVTPGVLALLGARAWIEYQPKGVVGVIAPWNFPLNLVFAPLAQIFAAGNRAMVKTSEYTPAVGAVLDELVGRHFAVEELAMVRGGPEVGKAFAGLPFDHLFFTGGTGIGRHILHAAADNLVPVTLELGGKSPVIIGKGTDLHSAAERVAHGKMLNAGQLCLAPDYLLVRDADEPALVDGLKAAASAYYPTLIHNPDYTSLISDRHLERLKSWLDDARSKGARIEVVNPAGENFEGVAGRKMPLHIVRGATDDMLVLQEEIFGPVLPIRRYDDIEDAIRQVNRRDRPLALYYFGSDAAERRHVLDRTISGGVTLDDVIFHFAMENLPFGGVGPSGMGAYHGESGFRTFSHARAIYQQSRFDVAKLGRLKPPYKSKA